MYTNCCRRRIRAGIVHFIWGILLVLPALILFMTVCRYLQYKGGKDAAHYVLPGMALAAGTGILLFGVHEGYTGIRDFLCPAKSRLAKSIRDQLGFMEGAPDWQGMFDMVDRDISENGRKFERLMIGREWILGRDASYIPNIRGIFGRKESVICHWNGRNRSRRIIRLYIVDYRRRVQTAGFFRPGGLEGSLRYLRLNAPEAYFGPYRELAGFCSKSEEEWNSMECRFMQRRAERMADDTAGGV